MLVTALLFALAGAGPPDITAFVREGCPRCAAAERFLDALPGATVLYARVDADPAARAELERVTSGAGYAIASVPTLVVRGRVLVGWADEATTGAEVRALLGGAEATPRDAGGTCAPEAEVPCDDGLDTPFGRVSVATVGLPAFTVAIGLLDGFNPCAMWVLLFLLSMLVNLHDRRKMALIAGTFVLTSGAVYYAFMAAWLNVFVLIGMSRAVQIGLGVMALGVGALNVKELFAFHRGPSLSIPEKAKPGIYARVRGVLKAESLWAALLGSIVLACMVNVIELLCTAGFPAVYTAILSRQPISRAAHYGYLSLYNVAYILDDSVMVGIAVITLSRRKLQESSGRWLKLISGVVMLGLGAALLFFPRLLS